MTSHPNLPLLATARAAQRLALQNAPANVPVAHAHDSAPPEVEQLLRRLLGDESALYAITREWRYDAAGRRFVRVHALLDEQFTEIGARLVKLAARSRALGCWVSTSQETGAEPRRVTVEGSHVAVHMVSELLNLHGALLKSLRVGQQNVAERFRDLETTHLLSELIADHEKDVFMLRALLWEVQNTAA
jgi:DNA-binding ferritin-like protein